MKFVGEIGINRSEYLYQLDYLDIIQIERGYERRHYHEWSIARWETYHLMAAFCGGKNLQENGINSPTDLMSLPWDKHNDDTADAENAPTPQVVEELRRKMREENERNGFK